MILIQLLKGVNKAVVNRAEAGIGQLKERHMATAKTQQAKQQRRLVRKRKAAEKQKTKPSAATDGLQKKIARNEFFHNMTLVDPSPTDVKMSGVMLDFLAPYMHTAKTQEAFEKLIALGLVGWNLAMEEQAVQQEGIDKFAETLDAEGAEDFRAIIAELIERKQRHFAQYTRKIVEYHLSERTDGLHLSVASLSG